MPKERADLDFGSALDDLGNFDPKPNAAMLPMAPCEKTKKAAEAAGFKSREPKAHWSQRTIQHQGKPETIEEYCDTADANGGGLVRHLNTLWSY